MTGSIGCVGNLTHDTIFWVDRFPEIDEVATVRHTQDCVGGRGAITAAIASALGEPVSLLTTVPNSTNFGYVSALQAFGANLAEVEIDSQARQHMRVFVTVGKAESNCTSLFLPSDVRYVPTQRQIDFVGQARLVYFTTHDIEMSTRLLRATKESSRVIVNVSGYMMEAPSYRLECLRRACVLLGNESDIRMLVTAAGIEGPHELFSEMPRLETIFVTKGSDGAEVFGPEGIRHRVPAKPAAVRTPVGIGDAFAAGVLLGECRGWPSDRSAALGSTLASASLASDMSIPTVDALRIAAAHYE